MATVKVRKVGNSLGVVMIAAAWLSVAGCGQSQPPAATAPSADNHSANTAQNEELPADVFPKESSTNTVKLNGWTISYPKSHKQMGMTMDDGVLVIRFEDFEFAVRDNVISVDDHSFGTATKGDVVLIGLNGEIAVNGKIRQPNEEKN